MKKLLLFITVLLLSLSAWTQDFDYYKTLLPKSSNFRITDTKIDAAGRVYILAMYKGQHFIPGIGLINSPDNNQKEGFIVLWCEQDPSTGEKKVKRIAATEESSNCYIRDVVFDEVETSIIIAGCKTSGVLKIREGSNDNFGSYSNSRGAFLLYLGKNYSYYYRRYKNFFPNIEDIDNIAHYNAGSNNYFILIGKHYDTATFGSYTLNGNGYFITKFRFNVTQNSSGFNVYTPVYSFAKKPFRRMSSYQYDHCYVKGIAINNSSIVFNLIYRGTWDIDPSSSTSTISTQEVETKTCLVRYGRVYFNYQNKITFSDYDIHIVSDKQHNFFASFREGTSRFVRKYNAYLTYQWTINLPDLEWNSSKNTIPIGVNQTGDLFILSAFRGTKNFNPKGNSVFYTSGSWDSDVSYFLGRYNSSNGKLITGNIMRIRDNANAFLSSNKSSSKISITDCASKVDYDLGIGEVIDSYSEQMYFIATYEPCSKTTISNNYDRTRCEGSEIQSSYVYGYGMGSSSSMRYRWYKDGELLQNGTFDEGLITNADTKQLKITNVTPEASGNYKLEVTSRCDIPRFSNEATFTVTPITHITQEPNGQIVCEGSSASFSVTADNSPTYQWQVNTGSGGFVNMPGKTSATLNLNDVDLNMAGYQYRCKVTGQESCNELYSNTVNLGVKATPQIQAQPQANTETCEGTPATISVVTDGAGLSYQWQVSTNNGSSFSNISNGANYSGTQNATLEINNPTLAYNDRIYRCVVSGECGSSVTSNQASLSVQKAVQLVSNPQSKNICQYEETTFNVNAEGDGLEYAWQIKNGSNWVNLNNDNTYSNVNNPSLDVHSAGTDMNGNQYRCKISSPCSTPIYSTTANLNVTPIPMATLSSSEGSDICEGNTTTLSSDIGSGSYTYQWKRNFSAVSGASNSTLTANQSGAYTLYVEENGSGCTFESDPIMLNVHALPNNTTTLDGSNQLCEGESRQLTVPAGNGYAYQWYQNGSPMSGQTSHALFVNTSGTYHAKIISDYACENISSDELITVNANPIVNLTTSDAELCEGEQTTINATSNSAYNYQWKRNGNTVTGETANALQVSQAGAYSVEVINASTNCSAVSDPLTVNVHTLPNNNITIIGNNAFCEGLSTELTVPAGNGYTYQWYKNNTPITGQTANSLTVNETGAYKAKITSAYACENISANENITVHPNPTVDLTTDDAELCEGEQTTINATSNSAYTYQWKRNGNAVTGETANALQVSQAGVYSVEAVNASTNCSTVSDPLTVNVRALPNNNITIVGNNAFCEGLSTELTVPAGNGYTYQWFKNNTPIIGQTANSLTVSETGAYKAKITSAYACENTSANENITVHPNPTVDLTTDDTELCEGEQTTINATSNSAYTYQWKRNGNAVTGETANALQVSQSGVYSVEVVNASTNCSAVSDPLTVNVRALPNNNITVVGGNAFCEGLSAELTVPAGNAYTYQWYKDNTPITGQTANSLTVNETGAYKAKITSAYACENISANENITVHPNPTVDLTTNDAEICEGEQTTINATSNSAYNYQWKRNGNNITGETANALQVSQAGIYSVEVVNTSTNCSAVSDPLTVSVHALPNNNITIVGNNAFCEGLSAELTVPAGNGYTYQWYQNDNPITGETANSLIVSQAGAYKAKIINAYGCENISATESITINPNPVISLTTDDAEICEGEQTTIEATSDANYTYQWKRNGSALTGETANTLQANQAGVYNVAVVNTVTNCSASSEGLSINVHSAPNNSITVLGEATFCEGLSTQLSIQAGSNCTFEWYKDNILINNQTSHSLFVSESGTYHAEITSAYGCENTSASETITVLPNPSVSLTSPDAELCEGETATINATSNENYTYQWKRNGMVLIGEASEQLQTEQAGVYSVEVLDATSSCTAVSDPISVSVHALPNNNVTLIGSSIFCEGLSAELTVPAGNGYAYQWYQNDTPIEGQNSNSLTVTESGAYHAEINDAYGCESVSDKDTIMVSPSPEVTLTIENSEICQGTETTISTEENSDYFYQWLHNNSEIPGATSHSVQVSEAGLYKVSVINTVTGCSGISDYTVVSVNPLPNPELSVSGTLTVCVEDSVELSLNESYSQYLWQDQSSNDNLYISESGVYSVTVTDENNCQNSAEIEINEILVPTPDICMVTVDTAINRNLIIWENVPNARGIASYNVYKLVANTYQLLGNVQYGDTTEFVDMTSEPHIHSDKYVIASVDSCGNVGEYSPYHQTMNLSIVNGAGDDADNGVVLIWTKYIDESGFNNPTEYEIYRGVDELTYHASVTGGLSDYNYNIPDAEEGEHFLIVVQRPSGCFPLNGVNELKANGGPYYNSISNMEDEGLLISGIKNTESGLFRIYPNPAKDRISIESDNHIERIRILDISGKVLLEQKANAGKAFNLDLSDFAKGLYFIEVNGQKAKLIKE